MPDQGHQSQYGEDSVDKGAANTTEGGEETEGGMGIVRTGQPDATVFTLNPASDKPSAKRIWRKTGEVRMWTRYQMRKTSVNNTERCR